MQSIREIIDALYLDQAGEDAGLVRKESELPIILEVLSPFLCTPRDPIIEPYRKSEEA